MGEGISGLVTQPVAWMVLSALLALLLAASVIAWWGAKGRLGRMLDAMQSLPYARLLLGRNGRVFYANAAWTKLMGGDEVQPLEALKRIARNDAETREQLQYLHRAAEASQSTEREIRVDLANAAAAWFQVAVYPLGERSGATLWGVEDVTARHEMEQIIREEQEKLIDFLENAPIGFYSVNQDGTFLFINYTLANWLGHTPEEILAGSFKLHDFLGGGADAARRPYTPFRDLAEERRGEVTLLGRDGRQFQAYVTQTIVQSEDGDGLRTRSLVRDLTTEREWAEALRLSEQRFHRFFEEAPVGIVLLDVDGTVAETNGAFASLAGVEARAVVGQPLRDFVAESDRSEVGFRLTQAIEGREPTSPLEVLLGPSGEKTASLIFRRLEDADGEVSGLILHVQDLSDQKSLEAQFMQSQKMDLVGQLAGGVAHDFNNLLTAMIGFCDLLLLRHKPGDQSFGDVMQIKQNANRAANLVRQLLAFSRQQTLQPRVLDITDVLAELSNLLRRLIGANIELNMVHGRELGQVKVDQGQLEQVIINLVVNARDAMGENGALKIRTGNAEPGDRRLRAQGAGDGAFVFIEVSDTGCGIPKDELDKIFEPFYTTKEVGTGTGLGLSTVYGIIKQTGGYIFVDSTVGEGSRFTIFLPLHVASADEPAQQTEAREPERRKDLTGAGTVMLVEDEAAVRLFGARALRNKGYNVIEAPSGEAALAILRDGGEDVDILITDVVMPGMDGPSLIREVRNTRPDLKVIFISGYTEDSFRKRLDTDSEIHFLPKPFSLQQLAGKVKEVIHADQP